VSDYPRLTEMGIKNPQQIVGYVVNSMNRIDTLRITYKRDKGEFLPTSQSFQFPRIQQTKEPDKKKGTVLKTDPFLREVEDELEKLLHKRKEKRTVAEAAREELDALEEEVTSRIKHARELLERLEGH